MNKWIWRASAAAFAAALGGSVACGSSSGCGGTNINSNTTSSTLSMTCGPGTYLSGTTCLPIQSTSGTAASSSVTGSSNVKKVTGSSN